jgi:hypothetical protein
MGSEAHLRNKRNRTGAPQVGIIFVVEGNIWIDATPLTEAADYGEFKIHERGHDKYWDQLLGMAIVAESEYDEHPRGRVVYNPKQRQYTLYPWWYLITSNQFILQRNKKSCRSVRLRNSSSLSRYMKTWPPKRFFRALGPKQLIRGVEAAYPNG